MALLPSRQRHSPPPRRGDGTRTTTRARWRSSIRSRTASPTPPRPQRRSTPSAPVNLEPSPVAFPADIDGAHADRARALLEIDLSQLAQVEVDALRGNASERQLIEAYSAVDAPWAAIRVAASLGRESRAGVR